MDLSPSGRRGRDGPYTLTLPARFEHRNARPCWSAADNGDGGSPLRKKAPQALSIPSTPNTNVANEETTPIDNMTAEGRGYLFRRHECSKRFSLNDANVGIAIRAECAVTERIDPERCHAGTLHDSRTGVRIGSGSDWHRRVVSGHSRMTDRAA